MSNNVASHNQKGGVTAQNVNITYGALQSTPVPPEDIKPKSLMRILTLVGGIIGFAASAVGVLDYFSITPW